MSDHVELSLLTCVWTVFAAWCDCSIYYLDCVTRLSSVLRRMFGLCDLMCIAMTCTWPDWPLLRSVLRRVWTVCASWCDCDMTRSLWPRMGLIFRRVFWLFAVWFANRVAQGWCARRYIWIDPPPPPPLLQISSAVHYNYWCYILGVLILFSFPLVFASCWHFSTSSIADSCSFYSLFSIHLFLLFCCPSLFLFPFKISLHDKNGPASLCLM